MSSADADPAQISFTPGDGALIATERGTNSISSYAIDQRGCAQGPMTITSSGQTPYGFGLTKSGSLIVSEAFGGATGAAAASSYVVSVTKRSPVMAATCMRSTPMRRSCLAGPWANTATSRRLARSVACPAPLPGWPPADGGLVNGNPLQAGSIAS
jgi:hypothetical protein